MYNGTLPKFRGRPLSLSGGKQAGTAHDGATATDADAANLVAASAVRSQATAGAPLITTEGARF